MGIIRTCLIIALLMLAACTQDKPERNTLRIGLASAPISLDPRFATDAASHRIQDLVHCSLVQLGEDFLPQPSLAISWLHPDPYTWAFELNHDFTFHNGEAVTAKDVAATINGVLNKTLNSPLQAGFSAIENISVDNDYHLTLTLNKPDASLLTRLNLGILPASEASKPHQAQQNMGCGIFKLDSWGNTLKLSRSTPDRTSIQTIIIMPIKDPVTRVLKLVRNEIDFTQNDLPPHLLPWLQQQPNIHITTQPSTTFSYLGLNMHDPILKHVKVRQALALALDRNLLKQALFADLPTLGETILTPNHWAAATIPLTPFNTNQAEILLDQAGFPRHQNGIRFTLNYRTSTNPTRLRLVTAIAAAWQKVGINVSIESLEWGGFYARIKRGDFQVFSLSWVGITDPDIYRWVLHTDMQPPKGANRGKYSNPQVDTWLDAASISESISQRKVLYAKVQQQMAKDQVYIPLWYDAVVAVSGERLQGFQPRNDGSLLPLLHATLLPNEK
ncbi:MAG: ABC transporter substrate-binding protein [Ghiorsea sp.]|nr:ABC transporter substrate-binding protein [Ghiorsea sp.]